MIVLAFDTETSGLVDSALLPPDKQPEIIEFYGCRVDLTSGEVLGELDMLIKPARAISDEITGITGLTNEDLADKPPFAGCVDAVEAFFAAGDPVMAHNLSFDIEMVDIEFGRLGRKAPWPRRKLCTVERTIHLKGFRLKLQELHEHLFGEGFPKAHRARNDVNAMVRCAVELYKRGEI